MNGLKVLLCFTLAASGCAPDSTYRTPPEPPVETPKKEPSPPAPAPEKPPENPLAPPPVTAPVPAPAPSEPPDPLATLIPPPPPPAEPYFPPLEPPAPPQPEVAEAPPEPPPAEEPPQVQGPPIPPSFQAGPPPIDKPARILELVPVEQSHLQKLAAVLVGLQPDRSFALGGELVDDLRANPAEASRKIAEMQLAVWRVHQAGLYDQQASERVRKMQEGLDQRLTQDRRNGLITDAFIVALASAAAGTIVGYKMFQRWSLNKKTVMNEFTESVAQTEAAKAAYEELTAAGLRPPAVRDLVLVGMRSADAANVRWKLRPSRTPGLHWGMFNASHLPPGLAREGEQVLVVAWSRGDEEPVYIASRSLFRGEAENVRRHLEKLKPHNAGEAVAAEAGEAGAAAGPAVNTTRRDVATAAGAAALAGIPFTGFLLEGYRRGIGEGRLGKVYLESLIPPDQVR